MNKLISLVFLLILLLTQVQSHKHFHYHLTDKAPVQSPLLDVRGIVQCLQTNCETIKLRDHKGYDKCADDCLLKARTKKGYQ